MVWDLFPPLKTTIVCIQDLQILSLRLFFVAPTHDIKKHPAVFAPPHLRTARDRRNQTTFPGRISNAGRFAGTGTGRQKLGGPARDTRDLHVESPG